MNKKDIAQIRRRLNPESQNPVVICGCYVNGQKNVVSAFRRSLISLPQSESEKYMQIFRRSLSGDVGRNLVPLTFPTDEVMDGATHARLIRLNQTALDDDEALNAFFDAIIAGTRIEGNFLILVLHDTYDVPFKTSMDDEAAGAESETVFSYVLCAVCPVKQTKPALSYHVRENEFHNRRADWLVSPPELGFLFPAFDDRAANIYNALFYSKNVELIHEEVIDAVFRVEPPMSAVEQKNVFDTALADTLEKDCSYDVVQSVHEQLRGRIQEHKESRDPAPLELTVGDVGGILSESGVSEEKVESFRRECEKQYGENAALNPKNILGTGKFEITTPEVKITVAPENSYLIEARMIGGRRYLLIPADDGVEVNGVSVSIPNEEHN